MINSINEKARKVAAIMALSNNYGKVMEDNLLDIWVDLLSGYSVQEVENGIRKVIEEYEYKTRPPFAVLKKAIDSVRGIKKIEPEKLRKKEAEDEWDYLLESISRYGRYNKPEFYEITEKVLRGMGGWDAACNWETAKLEWKHKEFIEKFELASEYEDYRETQPRALPNIKSCPQLISEILSINNRVSNG